MTENERLPGQGEATAESARSGDGPTIAHATPQVNLFCDACATAFEADQSALVGRASTPCPNCGWTVWTPREFWGQP